MIAVPTRELAGHAVASACGLMHATDSTPMFGCSDLGSSTLALFSAACSGLKRRVVDSGGLSPLRVAPGAPRSPTADGVNPSDEQPVGVSTVVRWEKVVGASQEFTLAS